MAPEVARRWVEEEQPGQPRTSYSHKVDLWSVGCIIFALDQKKDLFLDTPMNQDSTIIDTKLGNVSLEVDGLRFMKQLLQFNPSNRPTAKEGLESTWLSRV